MSDNVNVEKSSMTRLPAHGIRETGASNALSSLRGNGKGNRQALESLEEILELVLRTQGEEQAPLFLEHLVDRLRRAGLKVPGPVSTPYMNTIPVCEQPDYPGDGGIERRIRSIIRWNAMAMVVNANQKHDGLGGHISSFASSATLYEVAQNHFFRGGDKGLADFVFFQGHATPGNYARAFLEGRLTKETLANFRQELAEGGGLSSYPHPYLMPNFWQFPTVSMGLGPIISIYQARFLRYLQARGFIPKENEPKVWAFVGDGESDEPETLGALTLASRENL
ncbi:MAG TPA: pyruvate dehydrogenase (acetyl-transferring), homodimeric type, partial [Candidatus Limnocylindria bacterium]|nr:pyruvate dehydrogenase (acetyl-transferring), homodimeric type [Candidatus Limnocylindria bacterium]